MKFRIAFLVATLVLTGSWAKAQPKPVDAFEQNRKLGRGVNIIGYDPLWRSPERGRFQEKHFRLLKEAGFNSVRINLAPFRRMTATNNWAVGESWFKVMDWAVAGAQAQGLAVILDLHEYGAMGQNPEANKEKFLAFWRQLSAHCQNAPSSVFFEVLNEPSRNLTPELWNEYLREALAIIRERNPTRTVIAGPAFWNSIDHLSELELPAKDRYLIVTVHYYKPMEFTHQGASWTSQKYPVGTEWLGSEKDLAAIDRDFEKAGAWAKEHDRPVFVGEFGAYDKAPMESRARYTGAVARAAEKRGWSWAYWQFDNDFILYDIDHDRWVEPIKNALIPDQQRVR
ncbi:Glycoside hydrolase family 5 [Verrucomicrobia bacterium]|nr:Glycoside hydrolase family 5 [Verrucomicrobiota bacterium]